MFTRVLSRVFCPRRVSLNSFEVFKGLGYLLCGRFAYHSAPSLVQHSSMKIHILPALEDNYMYLIVDDDSKEAAIVDPVDPPRVMNAVKEHNVKLTTVLTTHHHWDHAGGNAELFKLAPNLTICGGDTRIDAMNKKVGHGDKFMIGSLNVECLFTPCHTTGHICYYVTDDSGDDPAVFTGDTLFIGGCGRFFEGTPDQMYRALIEILSELPDQTRVYCGHEYALDGLKFSVMVDPDNTAAAEKLAWAKSQRENNQPTVPSTIKDEKSYNPFMRVMEESMKKRTQEDDPIKVMGKIRREKDVFKSK